MLGPDERPIDVEAYRTILIRRGVLTPVEQRVAAISAAPTLALDDAGRKHAARRVAEECGRIERREPVVARHEFPRERDA